MAATQTTTVVDVVQSEPTCGRCNGTGFDSIKVNDNASPMVCATCGGFGFGFAFPVEGWENDGGSYGGYIYKGSYPWGRVDVRLFATGREAGTNWIATVTYEITNPVSSSPYRLSVTSPFVSKGHSVDTVYAWATDVLRIGPSYILDAARSLVNAQ